MLQSLVRFCIREPLIMLVLTTVAIGLGWMSLRSVPIDAIPNIGENQVIIFTSWPGRSPKDIEDQITYPLTTAMLSVPFAKVVRGYSFFGISFVGKCIAS